MAHIGGLMQVAQALVQMFPDFDRVQLDVRLQFDPETVDTARADAV